MKRLYELINDCWNFAKWMYTIPITSTDDWTRIYKKGSELAESFKSSKKENQFVRNMLCACMDYYEAECREQGNSVKHGDLNE